MMQRNPQMAGLLGIGQRGATPGGAPEPAVQQTTPAPEMPTVRQVQPNIPDLFGADPAQQTAPTAAPEAPPEQPSRGFLARLFAGDPVQGLSPEQNKKLRQNALLQAGLTMLAAGGDVSFSQALAMGVLAARQATAETAGRLLDEQQAAERIRAMTDIFADTSLTPRQQWEEVRRRAAVHGDKLMGEQANAALKELRENAEFENGTITTIDHPNGTKQTVIRMPDGRVLDMATREEVTGAPARPLEVDSTLQSVAAMRGLTSPDQIPSLPDAEAGQLFKDYLLAKRSSAPTTNIDMGTIPPGWRVVRDENGRIIQMEPIPGGPAAMEIEDEARRREPGRRVTSRAAQTVVEDVDRALDLVDKYGRLAAGVGGVTGWLPETPASQLSQHIESIKGNIGIDSLLKIKESGAGLGHIPQAQLEMLASLLGRLDVKMRPEDLRWNLQRISEIYEEIMTEAGGDTTDIRTRQGSRSQQSEGTTGTRTQRDPGSRFQRFGVGN